MAKKDIINLTKADYEKKEFKTAPGGTYAVKVDPAKTVIKKGPNGNLINIRAVIAKGPHKGTSFFDNIVPSVGWKIAQILGALGKKRVKSISLQEILALLKAKGGVELRALLRETEYEGKQKNEVVQWLPAKNTAVDNDEDEDVDEDEDEDDDTDDDDDDDSDDDDDDDDSDDDDDDDEDGDDDSDDDDDDDSDDDDEDDDSDDDEDEDEDEDEPAPKKKKGKPVAKKAPAKKAAAKKAPAKKGAAKKKK